MFQAKVYNADWIDSTKLVFPLPVEIYNNFIPPFISSNNNIKVLCVFSEPEPFRVSNAEVIRNQHYFDLILTYDEEILNSCKNSKLFAFGTTWILASYYQNIDIIKKKFEVSFLCGAKNVTEGHKLRQKLWYRQKEIKIPKTFWISGKLPVPSIDNNPILPINLNSKMMMFDCQFHIAIENVRTNNYFTEKLIDCLITKTIPIYWGCPNIEKYFDVSGMYIVDNEDEIINICNNLTPDDYYKKVNYVTYNYNQCLKYCEDITYRLQNIINEKFFIKSRNDNLLWGDIYSKSNIASQDEKVLNSDVCGIKKVTKLNIEENTLDKIRQAGLWSEGQPLRLHLGCGEQRFDGYVNIDLPPSEHNVQTKTAADIFADITTLNFPDQSVDEIRLHHVFEHFDRVTALAMLIKWHQWLKIGGKLHIETPDLIGSAKTLLSNVEWRVKTAVVRHLSGDQASSWAFHVDHWFSERFEKTLRKFGFERIQTHSVSWQHKPYLSNVHAIAFKACQLTLEELLQTAEELLWESTVSDTEKPTYKIWCDHLHKLVLYDAHSEKFKPISLIDNFLKISKLHKNYASILPLHEIHDFNQRFRDRWIQTKAKTIAKGAKVLDVGAGTCPYREFFTHCDYKAHDFKKYKGEKLGGTKEYGKIDFESDITNIPVPDNSFDVVICTEVLEHVPEPIKAIQEISRILKQDGWLFITAPLGSGLHQLPYHFYGGFTPEWYKYFLPKFGLQVIEITPNGGFFKLLAQECARVAWTFDKHQHLHQEYANLVYQLFNELLPRYLFALDEKCFIDQFTVGYHVAAIKSLTKENVSEEIQLLKNLQQDFRHVPTLTKLAEIELGRSNFKKAKNYLIAALAIDPQNLTAKALWEKLQHGEGFKDLRGQGFK